MESRVISLFTNSLKNYLLSLRTEKAAIFFFTAKQIGAFKDLLLGGVAQH